MGIGKKVNKDFYLNKNAGSTVFRWKPLPNQVSKKTEVNSTQSNVVCTAVAGSQGEDFITTYVYDLAIVDEKIAKLAYVECNYVE